METRACIVVITGCASAVFSFVGITVATVASVSLCAAFILWLEIQSQKQHDAALRSSLPAYRAGCGRAVYCCVLVPLAVILSCLSTYHHSKQVVTDSSIPVSIIFCLFLLTSSLLLVLVEAMNVRYETRNNDINKGQEIHKCWTAVMVLLSVLGFFVADHVFLQFVGCWEMYLLGLFTLIPVCCQWLLPRWMPGSFSPGEGAVVSHALALLLYSFTRALHSIHTKVYAHDETSSLQLTIFLQTAAISCLMVALLVFLYPQLRKPHWYYITVLFIMTVFALPTLYISLKQNFLFWILEFITKSQIRVYLFAYWLGCCFVAMGIVYINTQSLLSLDFAKESTPERKTKCSPPVLPLEKQRHSITTIVRKHFHLFAVCVFLPGLVVDKEMLCNASTCALVIFIMLETLRIPHIAPFGALLDQYFQVFIDSRDAGPVILTHIYLMAGCTLPLWLYPNLRTPGLPSACLSGVLSLGVGDTAASVFGTKLGRHKWSGTNKTIEGTFAAIVMQIIFVFLLFYFNILVDISWGKVITAVAMTSLLEAFTTQIDNLILPLYMYILLL